MNKPVFLTFGDGPFKIIKYRLINQAIRTGWFSNHIALDKTFLFQDEQMIKKIQHYDLLNRDTQKGYGYYFWKAYVIYKTLCTLPENQILFYLDAGSTLNPLGEGIFNSCITELNDQKNKVTVTFEVGLQTIIQRCKRDLIIHCNIDNNMILLNGLMVCSGIIFLKNTNLSREIVREWMEISLTEHFLDDSPSIAENYNEFIDHAHDQSVFSILVNKYLNNVIMKKDLSYFDDYNDDISKTSKSPILATRYRDWDLKHAISWVNDHFKSEFNYF